MSIPSKSGGPTIEGIGWVTLILVKSPPGRFQGVACTERFLGVAHEGDMTPYIHTIMALESFPSPSHWLVRDR